MFKFEIPPLKLPEFRMPGRLSGLRLSGLRVPDFRMPRLGMPGPDRRNDDGPVTDWTHNLVLFFRVLSLIQLAKGLTHWGLLINAPVAELTGIEAGEYLAANIYFAILDPVSGVGLWLTSSWGAVIWLLAAASQIAICVGFPEIFGPMWWLIAVETLAILLYIFLTWKVAEISDD